MDCGTTDGTASSSLKTQYGFQNSISLIKSKIQSGYKKESLKRTFEGRKIKHKKPPTH